MENEILIFLIGLLFFSVVFFLIGFIWSLYKIITKDHRITLRNIKEWMFDGYYGVPLWMFLTNTFSTLVLSITGIIIIIYYCGLWILELFKIC